MKTKNIQRLRPRPALRAAAVTAVFLFPVAPVHADSTGHQEGLEFSYTEPDIAGEGDRISWEWTITNTLDTAVDEVVLTHELAPGLTIVSVSEPCAPVEQRATCAYGRLKPGASVTGTVVAEVSADGKGRMTIDGRVTFKPDNGPADG
ncbi:hypothetical protein AB0K02_24520 [Streptomyces sp. NPDC049597]|uniref:hypothetical protein n=1 Tax=Streptomyces sp. NPDC049597 TaxID=3155276 RepID=UPI0034258CC5